MTAAAGMERRDTERCDLIPEVNLDGHVEGAVRPATVLELARKAGRPLPTDDPASPRESCETSLQDSRGITLSSMGEPTP